MRTLMTVSMETAATNAAVREGKLVKAIQRMLTEIRPEAAYFTNDNDGNRFGMVVFDMKDSSQIPGIAEPWFLGFNAKVTFRPAMSAADLAAAGPALERAGKQK